jgi:hypothetical protein
MLTEDDVNSSLVSFCQLEYWKRIWTLPEIILPPKSAWLVRGNCKLEADHVFHIFSAMKSHVGDCCINFARTHLSLFEAGDDHMRAAGCRAFRARAPEAEVAGIQDHLDQLHTWFGTRNAKNPRDHVYGLLGLLSTSYSLIVPNYTDPIADVFTEATMACISARMDLNVLELVLPTPRVTRGDAHLGYGLVIG